MILTLANGSRRLGLRLCNTFLLAALADPFFRVRYEILSDPQSREVYDEYGLEGLTKGFDGPSGGVDPADLFAELFSGGGFSFFSGPRMSRPRREEDSVIPYDVTLEDLYNGKHVKMSLEKEIVCGVCRG